MAIWRNWSGQQRCSPVEEVHPASAEEVADAVRRAARSGLHVRVAGAGHSFTDAVCTPDMLLVLDRMRGVAGIERDAGHVRVQAGCTFGALSQALSRHGLTLRNLGDIDRQTVAGAVATGTHGAGVELPSLAAEVVELELIDGAGNLRTLSATADEEQFRAAQISLGALGVVTCVTLRCQPAFRLRRVEEPRPLEQILDRLGELSASHEHFEIFTFPYAGSGLARWADRTDAPPTRRPVQSWVKEVLVANYLFEVVLAAGRAAPPLVPLLDQLAARTSSHSERVQASHDALASRRLMRFVEMEWVLPAEAAAPALRAVRQLIHRRRLKINMPIELRFIAADQPFLSPAHGRRSCSVAVHAYRGTRWQPYFRAVERLMWELDGRPHWGKLHFQTFETLRARYPAWDRFQDVRARFDPEGRFRNAYTDRVLGVPADAGPGARPRTVTAPPGRGASSAAPAGSRPPAA